MVPSLRLRQRLGGALVQQPLDRAPFGLNAGQVEALCARACNHDQVDARGHQIGPEPEALAAQALDAVALDRISHFAGDDQTDARRLRQPPWLGGLGGHEQREVRRDEPASDALGTNEFRMCAEPPMAVERERHARPGIGPYFL
jgi:hypothetical protein